jgi:hypothetical protein
MRKFFSPMCVRKHERTAETVYYKRGMVFCTLCKAIAKQQRKERAAQP